MIDPIAILKTLLLAGHEVFYADTDLERLRWARSLGAHKVIDASKYLEQSMHHPEVMMVVFTPAWDVRLEKECKFWGQSTLSCALDHNGSDRAFRVIKTE